MTLEIVFETHSWSEDNDCGLATGWLPGRLSEHGRLLAAELGDRRHNDAISTVFTSDLARAAETAASPFDTPASPYCTTGGFANAITATSTERRPLTSTTTDANASISHTLGVRAGAKQ